MFDDSERPVSPSSLFEDHRLFAASRQISVDTVVSTPPALPLANHYPHITEDHQAFKYLQQLRANGLSAATTATAPCGLANECHREGSLFSIHSAPPVPLADTHGHRRDSSLSTRDTMAVQQSRPVSLALDPNAMLTVQFAAAHSSTAAADLPIANTNNSGMPSDEADDEENENLWTVSSLTARPLIAKSKELRNIRFIGKSKASGGAGGGGRTKKSGASSGRADDGTSVGGLSKGSGSDSTAIDGGYGWLVVFGAFSVQFWVAGLVKSYGVLYVEIMESFPNASAGKYK